MFDYRDQQWRLAEPGQPEDPNTSMPKTAIAVMLSGIAMLVAVLLLRPAKDYVGIPLLIGSLLFMLGLKVTIDELPDRPVPPWLGLVIVIVLGLSLPATVFVTWLLTHAG
jgi:hypothetical protein